MQNEPILQPELDRLVMFPIKYETAFDMYKKHLAAFWTVEEVSLTPDLKDWEGLSDGEQHFIKHVLAFFAASDGIVNENICYRFAQEVQVAEIRAYYTVQMLIETVHSEMYSLLIDTYVQDEVEKDHLLRAIETVPYVTKKADWAMKWMDGDASFGERLVAFAAVEGIHFSGSFCALFWLKNRGLMPGLTFSNELISRDEGMHRDFAVHVHSLLNNPVPAERIREIIGEAVEIEIEFVTDALPVSLIGMNADLMSQYIRFVADHLLGSLGVEGIYGDTNPFPWMEMISVDGKTNFFERRVAEYAKAGVAGQGSGSGFSMDSDF